MPIHETKLLKVERVRQVIEEVAVRASWNSDVVVPLGEVSEMLA